MSETALNHIQHLSVAIGPRGSTTPQEKEAHDYVRQVLSDLGCEVRTESFYASTSTYLPFILGLGLVLVAQALFWLVSATANAQAGALAAAALSALALVSLVLELTAVDNPVRWFTPVAPSQNVVGVVPAKGGEAQRTVAVMAHVDSHRTPFIWYSRNTFGVYRAIVTLGFISLAALTVMYAISVFGPGATLRAATLVPAGVVLLAWLMVVQAHFTPFTAGANDNASGVGVMLALAERLQQAPLSQTEVWLVASGCEEVGAYGSADFVRRHKDDLASGALIVVDNIAAKDTGPVYLSSETLLLPNRYPADMLALAEEISAARPELGGRSQAQQGAYTDGIHGLKAGLKTLTFVGYTRDGWIPNWHNPTDVFAQVDGDAVERTEQFAWDVLQKLDAA